MACKMLGGHVYHAMLGGNASYRMLCGNASYRMLNGTVWARRAHMNLVGPGHI